MKDRPWMSRAASMAVAVALSAPLTLMVVSLEADLPTLSVQGAQINMMADGSAQLLFDVGIENVEKSDGAYFHDLTAGSQLPANFSRWSDVVAGAVTNQKKNYYIPTAGTADGDTVSAQAKVILRPVTGLVISSPSRMEYTYGQYYDPALHDGQGNPMRIELVYESDPAINNDARNQTSEIITFGVSHYDDSGAPVTTFEARHLQLYYVGDGQTVEQAITAGQKLTYKDYLTVGTHNGKHIAVVRDQGSSAIHSNATTQKLTVKEKTLLLTANRQDRAYGESNLDLKFSFKPADLAQPDQKALDQVNAAWRTDAAADGNAVLTTLAGKQSYTYDDPDIATAATPGSDVKDGGNGYYDITLSGGSLTNYKFAYAPGELHIYPRMIRIEKFISDANRPIYTIYANTTALKFYTSVTNLPKDSAKEPSVTFTDPSTLRYVVDGVSLEMTSGTPVYGNDKLILDIMVDFLNKPTQADYSGTWSTKVASAALASGGKNQNYILEQSGSGAVILTGGDTAVGMIMNRSIESIQIVELPTKREYTYGEDLNLDGLAVSVVYTGIPGEELADRTRRVEYYSRDQFAGEGLYVNYYDSETLKEESEDWLKIFGGARNDDGTYPQGKYPAAATGDHLTIAPAHEKFQGKDFSANGKYLIVSAQLSSGHTTPVEPQILPTQVATGVTEKLQLKVNPLPLTFTLSAQDKTYDGSTQAAGSITFTNPYHDQVVDQIYPITGADYERDWNSLSANESFKTVVNALFHGGSHQR